MNAPRRKSPIESMLEAHVRCSICNAPFGQCDCWTTCDCGWFHLTGESCRNPIHRDGAA